MTYTQYRLTDAQLRRLSAIVNKTKGAAKRGQAGNVLVRKGLAVEISKPHPTLKGMTYSDYDGIEATDAGRAALEQARREGW